LIETKKGGKKITTGSFQPIARSRARHLAVCMYVCDVCDLLNVCGVCGVCNLYDACEVCDVRVRVCACVCVCARFPKSSPRSNAYVSHAAYLIFHFICVCVTCVRVHVRVKHAAYLINHSYL